MGCQYMMYYHFVHCYYTPFPAVHEEDELFLSLTCVDPCEAVVALASPLPKLPPLYCRLGLHSCRYRPDSTEILKGREEEQN